MKLKIPVCAVLVIVLLLAGGRARTEEVRPAVDLSKDKVLYVVATAHLDTQWRWTIQATIQNHIPRTFNENFALFEKFPGYKFSFEGAFRYMLIQEYYPQVYAKLKEYVARGNWCVSGSWVDACDVNVPSPEALIRQTLYGNGFFRREFGKTSRDVFLPDCFGFGYALPSVAAHCGLKGFSTQKLTWGSSVGIPFGIGVWEGVDGSRIVAALNPGGYTSRPTGDFRQDKGYLERIQESGAKYGVFAAYRYVGTGDTGGSPGEKCVESLQKSLPEGGPIRVLSAASDQLYRDVTPAQMEKLPRYKGELLLTTHGTGCYSSQAAMKRWNRKNELLGDAAERAAVLADWLGASPYPRERLAQAWVRFLWHEFHDDLTGTSIPQVYEFSWNDELLAQNQFAAMADEGAGAVTRALDTRVQGVALAVFNPLAFEREDIVEAHVRFPGGAPKAVRVFDPDGQEVPAQCGAVQDGAAEVLFLAQVPSLGFKVFDVRASETPCALPTGLTIAAGSLENASYSATVDAHGDLASLKEKKLGKELLASPARLQIMPDKPNRYPAWEIAYRDLSAPPRGHIEGQPQVRIVERGPARVALEISRETEFGTVIQRWRLGAGGAGERLECDTRLLWRGQDTLLKAAFPWTASNPKATYDLGLGAIERVNDTDKLYEVPAQQWADLTAADGSFGAAVLNDCKYGWDKPNDNTLRLTLLHVPVNHWQDQGRHRVLYAIRGHAGDWRAGQVAQHAARLNQPLRAFQCPTHEGVLGKSFSFLSVGSPQVLVKAVKKAEESDEIVVRLQELHGQPAEGVVVSLAAPIVRAREVNGAEEPLGAAEVKAGKLVASLRGFQPRAFALTLAAPAVKLPSPVCQPVALPFDTDVISRDEKPDDGDFDGQGHALPAELVPPELLCQGLAFKFGPTGDGAKNALACRGQTVPLPEGDFNRVYVLAASAGGDTKGVFTAGDKPVEVAVQDFTGFIGQWDRPGPSPPRAAPPPKPKPGQPPAKPVPPAPQPFVPGFVKPDTVAWVGTHRHAKAGNELYVFCYLYKYRLDLPRGARTLTLPQNEKIKVLALTVARNANDDALPVGPPRESVGWGE